MNYIYLVLEETDAWGAWTNPVDAVKWYFRDEYEKNDGLVEHRDRKGQKFTPGQMANIMLSGEIDYPVLEKVPVNPEREPWTMDR